MDSKTLYKNLLGDLEMKGNDWVEVVCELTTKDNPIPRVLMVVRERDALLIHLDERKVFCKKITKVHRFTPEFNKPLIESCGIFVAGLYESEICKTAEAIKEFYKFM